MLIDIVLAYQAAYLLWRKREQKEKRGAARTRRGRERQNQKNNKRMRKRGIEAGTSPLSVPNEEKRAGIIIKKPH